MAINNLMDWLNSIQSLHSCDMDLSLERVIEVGNRLNVLKPICSVITVAGTNGKGSCVAGLEAIYLSAGYRVGVFTSPILFRHNEYVRIQGVEVTDEQFCDAFARIEEARSGITLTPFEFNALAAFVMFQQAPLDVWILEVGLGGRFDAVNAVDADVSIIASIDLDHMEWLGETREKIAYEKAGVFRTNKSAVCGDYYPPMSLSEYAKTIGTTLYCQTKQFGFEKETQSWTWWSQHNRLENLPLSSLALQNMASVLMAVELLQEKLPVATVAIHQGLKNVFLPGRIQVFSGDIPQIFDVSHNPAAALHLAKWLRDEACSGTTHAVFSMLADKDITATLRVMKEDIGKWYIAELPVKRRASIDKMRGCFQQARIKDVMVYPTIPDAYAAAMKASQLGDRIIVFGSFHTVAEVGRQPGAIALASP